MSNQNLDGIKPLSEEEESHILGGGTPGKQDVCAPMAQQIASLEMQIKSFPAQAHNNPAYRLLEQQLADVERLYQICEANSHSNPIPVPNP